MPGVWRMAGSACSFKALNEEMPVTIWQRLLITLIVLVLASFVAGLVWRDLFDARIPSYLSGLIGGITALAVWELLRGRPRR